MKSWRRALKDSVVPGVAAGIASLAAVAARGWLDTGSAIAPINASSHVIRGDKAARVEEVTVWHSLPGGIINAGAAMWWALVFQKLFGSAVSRRGAPAALLGGVATSGLAYAVDYHLIPRRLTPGWEKRISNRSLGMSLGAMAAGLAIGAILVRSRAR